MHEIHVLFLLVPPIIITKSPSVATFDSNPAALYGSNDNPPSPQPNVAENNHNHDEEDTNYDADVDANEEENNGKPNFVIEERTQQHHYGEPPANLDDLDHSNVTIKKVNPVVIMKPETLDDPTLVPVTEIPEAKKAAEEAGILPSTTRRSSKIPSNFSVIVRLSTANDVVVPIPTEEPYMTVAELKKQLPPHKSVKCIHLGRVLEDNYILVPSKHPASDLHIVKISNKGVIQALLR